MTGSVNAGLAQWLFTEGQVDGSYTVRQGTALGRGGQLNIAREGGIIWVGGACRSVIRGRVSF